MADLDRLLADAAELRKQYYISQDVALKCARTRTELTDKLNDAVALVDGYTQGRCKVTPQRVVLAATALEQYDTKVTNAMGSILSDQEYLEFLNTLDRWEMLLNLRMESPFHQLIQEKDIRSRKIWATMLSCVFDAVATDTIPSEKGIVHYALKIMKDHYDERASHVDEELSFRSFVTTFYDQVAASLLAKGPQKVYDERMDAAVRMKEREFIGYKAILANMIRDGVTQNPAYARSVVANFASEFDAKDGNDALRLAATKLADSQRRLKSLTTHDAPQPSINTERRILAEYEALVQMVQKEMTFLDNYLKS